MKKKRLIFTVLLVVVLGLVGCTNEGKKIESDKDSPAPTIISAEEAKLMIDESKLDENDELIIVDVRRPDEYKEEHIEDSILIPLDTIANEPTVELPDKDAKILIYCRSGNRSNQAAHKLIEMGYTSVYDFGGIIDWPYETVKGE